MESKKNDRSSTSTTTTESNREYNKNGTTTIITTTESTQRVQQKWYYYSFYGVEQRVQYKNGTTTTATIYSPVRAGTMLPSHHVSFMGLQSLHGLDSSPATPAQNTPNNGRDPSPVLVTKE